MFGRFQKHEQKPDDAIAFLKLFAPRGPWVLAATGPKHPAVSTFLDNERKEAADWLKKKMADQRRILVLTADPAYALRKPPGIEDLVQSRFIGIEIEQDGKALLERFRPKPFVVVATPRGFSVLWRLIAPLKPQLARTIAGGLAQRFNGRPLDFFLPVPGTVRDGGPLRLIGLYKDSYCLATDFKEIAAQAQPEIKPRQAVPIDSVESQPIDWVWEQVIAAGKVNLLGGVPGLGKSQVSISIAATVSRGRPWPGSTVSAKRGAVLMLVSEDDAGDTIKPRLEAAGADFSRVFVSSEPLSLSEDLDRLKAMAEDIADLRLIIFDPVSRYAEGANATVRRGLTSLVDWAGKRKIGLVGIQHPVKGENFKTVDDFFGGAAAFLQLARVAWMILRTPGSEETLMIFAKSNIIKDKRGFRFHIETTLLPSGIETSRVVWSADRIQFTAEDYLGGRKATSMAASNPSAIRVDKMDQSERSDGGAAANGGRAKRVLSAAQWLEAQLKDGPQDGVELKAKAQQAGYKAATLYRAGKKLGVHIEPNGFGKSRIWRMVAVTMGTTNETTGGSP